MKQHINKFLAIIGLCIFTISTSNLVQAQFFSPGGGNKATAEIISSANSVAPGQTFDVALKVAHPGKWHSYYKNAGGPSLPLKFKLNLPEGYTSTPIQWPVPHIKWVYDIQNYLYEGNTYFLTQITVPASATVGDSFTLSTEISVQLCDDKGCLPPTKISASKEIGITAQPINNDASIALIAKARKALPAVIDTWNYSAKKENDQLLLTIKTTADLSSVAKPIFITDKNVTDTSKSQSLTKTDEGYLLTVPLKKEAKLDLPLQGVLTSESHSLLDHYGVTVVIEDIAGLENTPPAKETVAEDKQPQRNNQPFDPSAALPEDYYLEYDTYGDIAEMSKFDHSSTIHTLSIDQINNNGEVINDKGEVIPKGSWSLDADGNVISNDGTVLNKKKKTTFLWALLLIFGGGLILNLMPCVFPVLGVKVLGFVQLSGDDPKKIKKHGLVFTLGVVVSMWILAGILLAVRSFSGEAISWGSQMQNPYFVGSMIILLALFALNLFGVFEVGTSLTSAGGNLQQKKGYQGSFFSGMLTTLIATPCGAPFLATAMAYTLQQTAFIAMILFTVFALGVAFPYLVLSFVPKLINKLPKPGNWMVTFKKSMSFSLLATCAFLLMPFIDQTGSSGIKWMIWSLVVFATAAFIYGNWSTPYVSKTKRWVVGYGFTLVFAAAGAYFGYIAMSKEPIAERAIIANTANQNQPAVYLNESGWKPWRTGKVDHSRSKDRMVWVDYTASW